MKANQKSRILVVDDEMYLREIVAFDLARKGYHVTQADCGDSAQLELEKADFDMVVSDVRMPNGNGIALLKWIKQRNALTPTFLFMTAFADISADEALAMGAEAFLVKPIAKAELTEAVERKLVGREERWGILPTGVDAVRHITTQANDWEQGALPGVVFGSGGLFLEMNVGFPGSLETTAFAISINNPAVPFDRLEGYAQVRWVRHQPSANGPSGIGLEFIYLEQRSRQHYLDFLASSAPQAYVPLGEGEVSGPAHDEFAQIIAEGAAPGPQVTASGQGLARKA